MGGTAADSHGFPCARDMTAGGDMTRLSSIGIVSQAGISDRVPGSRNRSCVNTHPVFHRYSGLSC